jgi:hypothetical protein
MSKPKGVADHPAKDQMEAIWRDGGRAKEIIAYLEEAGLPVVKEQTLARYGQRYWSEKIKLTTDGHNIDALDQLLDQIEEAELGTITKIGISRKRYPGWEKEDGISIPVEKESISQSVEVVPNRFRTPNKADIGNITVNLVKEKRETKSTGLKLAYVIPDEQIGYHVGRDGEHTTTHDEAAISVAHQILGYAEQRFGVDLVVNLGDNLDLPGFSTHRSAPGFTGPAATQLAVDRYGTEVATQRKLAPDAQIVAFNGNHENRLNNTIVDKLPALHGISKANDRTPLLSVANLCRFDEFGIESIDTYPDGVFWANDYLKFVHGHTASSVLGATSAKMLGTNRVSTVFGHIHRQELLRSRVEDSRRGRQIFAGSPGCLCRIDGVLPSGQTGIRSNGGQAGIKQERWQHGVFLIWYNDEGFASPEPVFIDNGYAVYDGKEFIATVTPNGDPVD